ncbi:hypothetical protein PROFUN_16604 [Planoprotostelium fungivorum]|uniref:Uncharacterized protein n=1 Tax=Planoprotostelium fungivorum TaxID=1890364 RepID=A0A2P6MQ83_9EUKA|nr:hypothetical protein PROFUN_16604 [Planoprotostelium fungivorum]
MCHRGGHTCVIAEATCVPVEFLSGPSPSETRFHPAGRDALVDAKQLAIHLCLVREINPKTVEICDALSYQRTHHRASATGRNAQSRDLKIPPSIFNLAVRNVDLTQQANNSFKGTTTMGVPHMNMRASNLFGISLGTPQEPTSRIWPTPRPDLQRNLSSYGSTPQDVHMYEREDRTCPQPAPTTLSNDSDHK